MGKDFLKKLLLHSENVEEEEYLFLLYNEASLHPEHAEEEKYFFFYFYQRNMGFDSTVRLCSLTILRMQNKRNKSSIKVNRVS